MSGFAGSGSVAFSQTLDSPDRVKIVKEFEEFYIRGRYIESVAEMGAAVRAMAGLFGGSDADTKSGKQAVKSDLPNFYNGVAEVTKKELKVILDRIETSGVDLVGFLKTIHETPLKDVAVIQVCESSREVTWSVTIGQIFHALAIHKVSIEGLSSDVCEARHR